jgi:hypothetical protein
MRAELMRFQSHDFAARLSGWLWLVHQVEPTFQISAAREKEGAGHVQADITQGIQRDELHRR